MYSLLANLTAILHGVIVGLYLLSLFYAYKIANTTWGFATFMVVGSISLFGLLAGNCPLTYLEKYLRAKANLANEDGVYKTSFVSHYVRKLLKVEVSDTIERIIDFTTGAVICSLIILIIITAI